MKLLIFICLFLVLDPVFVQGCDQNINFTEDMIQNAGANILSDPIGVSETFKSFVCVSLCTELEQSVQLSKAAFDLAVIDIKLVLNQTTIHTEAILTEHVKNKNSILKTPLIILVNSFTQTFGKILHFLCDSQQFIDEAVRKAIPEIQYRVFDIHSTIGAIQQTICADKNNVYIKHDIPMKYDICIRRAVNAFTVDFNEYLAYLARFKYYYPDLTVELANCLIKNEPLSDLKVALETARCLGYAEEKRFKQFYGLISEGLIKTADVIGRLQNAIANINKCGSHYIEKFYDMVKRENVSNCNLND